MTARKPKPSRRPRGEKPATTIRLLRRQINTMEDIIAGLRLAIADKEKVIAGYDVQLAETNDEIMRRIDRTSEQSIRIGHLTTQLRDTMKQLAFLSGYYARSQEELGAVAPRETLTRRNPGNSPTPAHASQDRQGPRFEGSAEGRPSPDRGSLRDFQGVSSLAASWQTAPGRDFTALTPEGFATATDSSIALTAEEESLFEQMRPDNVGPDRRRSADKPYRGIDGPL